MQDRRFRLRYTRLTVEFDPASPLRRSSWLIDFLVGLMASLAASLVLLYGTPVA